MVMYKFELTSTSTKEIIEALKLQIKTKGIKYPFAEDVLKSIKEQIKTQKD